MVNLANMSNSTFDVLKRAAELGLPALGALYFALAQIWGLPYGEQVVGTVAAVNTFVGVIVVIARNQYNNQDGMYDGDLLVSKNSDDAVSYMMELNHDPEEILGQTEFRLKVKKQ